MKQKLCWVAKEYKRGWRLGFAVGEQETQWIPKIWFGSEKDVTKSINAGCVFIHLSGR